MSAEPNLVKQYRGYTIVRDGESFHIQGTYVRCSTAWSCMTYIDELMSP
jgi:hypothetical protein